MNIMRERQVPNIIKFLYLKSNSEETLQVKRIFLFLHTIFLIILSSRTGSPVSLSFTFVDNTKDLNLLFGSAYINFILRSQFLPIFLYI
jgi:hypothetical protein